MLMHLKAAQDEQQKINRSLDIRLGELAETNVGLYESNRLKTGSKAPPQLGGPLHKAVIRLCSQRPGDRFAQHGPQAGEGDWPGPYPNRAGLLLDDDPLNASAKRSRGNTR